MKDVIIETYKVEPPAKWLRRRDVTTRIFLSQTFLLGVEYSAVFLTLWIYITTLVDAKYPKLIYTLTASGFNISAMIASVLIGKIVDRYRNIRTIFLTLNTLVIVGNLIYAMHFSPSCLILGRVLAGTGGSLRSIITGEIARSYHGDRTISQFSKIGMVFNLGFLIGPAFITLFSNVNVTIGAFRIQAGNACGLYMAVLFIVQQIFVYFFVHDLSKEYDLKAEFDKIIQETTIKRKWKDQRRYLKLYFELSGRCLSSPKVIKIYNANDKLSAQYSLISANGKKERVFTAANNEKTSLLPLKRSTLSAVLTNIDIMMLFLFSFLFMYNLVTFDLWLPIMVINTLKWSLYELIAIDFGTSLFLIVVLIIISIYPILGDRLLRVTFVAILSMIGTQITFYLIKYFHDHYSGVISLWFLWSAFFTIGSIAEEICAVTTLSKMVSSNQQTFVESIRLVFARLGSLTALLSSVYIFDYLLISVIIQCFCWVAAFLLFLSRQKYLRPPFQVIQ